MIRSDISRIVSIILWDVSTIKVSLQNPFKLASGNMSPIYIDCRIPISHTAARHMITTCALWLYEDQKLDADYIAGGESAGIPYAAWLADRLGKPLIYVRKQAKGYGACAQIEGDIKPGKSVLLNEDLITDGGSKLSFASGIRKSECIIKNCLVVFDRQQSGRETLAEENIALHSMTDMETSLKVGLEGGYISEQELKSVKEYLENPALWHTERGLSFRR